MDWLSANWVWVLIGVAFVAMHVFGHRGHGGHGGSAKADRRSTEGGSEDRQETHGH